MGQYNKAYPPRHKCHQGIFKTVPRRPVSALKMPAGHRTDFFGLYSSLNGCYAWGLLGRRLLVLSPASALTFSPLSQLIASHLPWLSMWFQTHHVDVQNHLGLGHTFPSLTFPTIPHPHFQFEATASSTVVSGGSRHGGPAPWASPGL